MNLTALVPIKKNSERFENKNFLQFCGQPLYRIILEKLQAIDLINKIVINTDSEVIADDCQKRYSKTLIIKRPNNICGNEITMNTLIKYDLTQVHGEHFLQTHCTNPLLSIRTIKHAINLYFKNLTTFDSLLTVESIKKRGFNNKGIPINHDNSKLEKTQDLPEIYIENSNLFLFSRGSFNNNSLSRIGKKPQFLTMSFIEGIDIDFRDDFILAEMIYKNKHLFEISN
ncbi:MAG: acylneuraminate cytidylyltransferase family protein [Bacteroidales bacterium]|nr:acylneuraminate cytidylyltransferase family protein [Bacteroidales bacterium]